VCRMEMLSQSMNLVEKVMHQVEFLVKKGAYGGLAVRPNNY